MSDPTAAVGPLGEEKRRDRWEISEGKTSDGEFMVLGGDGDAWGLVACVVTAEDACLVAAAPDLLAALLGCIPQLELGNGEAEHIKAAWAAIRRATGEETSEAST